MDHSIMHNRRPSSSSSGFTFEAAASLRVTKQEDYDDSAPDEVEEEEKDQELAGEVEAEESYPKEKRMNLPGGGGSRKKGPTTVAATSAGGGVALAPLPQGCQVDKCEADLSGSKRYHQRHKVCEFHSKAQVVTLAGQRQRFCQQCSRFHALSEFDDVKRSCRRRLAGHNERRRKHFGEFRGEGTAAGRGGSATQIRKKQCRPVDERGITQMALSESHQKFHIH